MWPHKEATNSSMFLKLEFKGKNTGTGEHTLHTIHHFMCRNSNPALLGTNMFSWTPKSLWTLYGLAHWGKEKVLGQAMTPDTIHWWTVKILQLVDAFWLFSGLCSVVVISRVGSTARSTGRTSPGTAAPQGLWKHTRVPQAQESLFSQPRGKPQWNSHFSEESLTYGLYSHVPCNHLHCFLSHQKMLLSRFLMKNFLCFHFPKTSCRNVQMQMSICSTKLKGGMVAVGLKNERKNLYTGYKNHEA